MNVMILGAKPSPEEPPGCRVHEELLDRIGRIEKCLERIELALAQAGASRTPHRPRGKAGNEASRADRACPSGTPSGEAEAKGAFPSFITGSSVKGGARSGKASFKTDPAPAKPKTKTQPKQ